MKKDKQINIRVPQKMYEAITSKAQTEYKEVSEIIRELVSKWLTRNSRKGE